MTWQEGRVVRVIVIVIIVYVYPYTFLQRVHSSEKKMFLMIIDIAKTLLFSISDSLKEYYDIKR